MRQWLVQFKTGPESEEVLIVLNARTAISAAVQAAKRYRREHYKMRRRTVQERIILVQEIIDQ